MKGTLWLAWRQQRTLILVGAALLVACAVWVAFQRADMMAYISDHHIDTANCKGWDGDCRSDAAFRLLDDYNDPMRALGTLSAALPVLIGIFWGAPLLGRELESGTWKLALTQGVGIRRWFLSRFSLALCCSVVGSAVLAALVVWWWEPVSNMLNGLYWHDGYIFNATGPVAVASAVFGLVTGTAAGLLLRRTVAAMGATLVAVVGLRVLLNAVRHDWVSPVIRRSQGDTPREYIGTAQSAGDFGFIDRAGNLVHDPAACAWGPGLPDMKTCMAQKGFTGRFYKVYPASDFWVFQWIETAIFLGLAAALLALICVVLRRRVV
ncbi:transporter [Streptomyces sp. UNOC14_S4]|uniref:transporter n=1 Tax=Streptomyces sp. UNOC14_S4 TaxID=2872340 RepID=UPI001E38E427|nr:transporter [Streptomyces sp. UNOC14_S4]MCC3772355.1 transporter [Streptomyces sp. UNOC14_S4]